MKKLSLVLLLILTTTLSFAKKQVENIHQRSSLNKSKFDIRKPIGKIFKTYKQGIRIGLATGSLNLNLRSRDSVEGISRSSSENETNRTNFQFQLGYEEIKFKKLGFTSFLTYQDIDSDNGNFRNLRVTGNASYGITAQAYIYSGLNYSKYYGPANLEDILEPGIGYQAGIGFKLHKRAQLEIEYLTLLNQGSKKGINYDIVGKGTLIKLNTPLFF